MTKAETPRGRSLVRRVTLWCAATLAVFSFITAGISFALGYEEAKDRQDDILKEVVGMLSRDIVQQKQREKIEELTVGGFYGPGSVRGERLPQYSALTMDDDQFEDRYQLDDDSKEAVVQPGETVLVRMLHKKGRAAPVTFDRPYTNGAHTAEFAGQSYRFYIRTLADGTHVAAGQRLSERNKEILFAALLSASPILLLMPVMLAVLIWVLWRGLRPVKHLAAEIEARQADDLSALKSEGVPEELGRIMTAVNGLLARVEDLRGRETRFVADAAHELRSPVTALSLQVDRLGSMPMSEQAEKTVRDIRLGIARLSNLIAQLLTLKRVQAGQDAAAEAQPLRASCLKTVTAVVEDIYWEAESKNIAVEVAGFENKSASEACAALPESSLFCLMRNLVHNAVNYVPEGGAVTISCEPASDRVRLRVADNGPGIAENERHRVFDPFYRVLGTEQTGTGLGLAICKTIADRYGCTIALDWTDPEAKKGLCVTVDMPVAR